MRVWFLSLREIEWRSFVFKSFFEQGAPLVAAPAVAWAAEAAAEPPATTRTLTTTRRRSWVNIIKIMTYRNMQPPKREYLVLAKDVSSSVSWRRGKLFVVVVLGAAFWDDAQSLFSPPACHALVFPLSSCSERRRRASSVLRAEEEGGTTTAGLFMWPQATLHISTNSVCLVCASIRFVWPPSPPDAQCSEKEGPDVWKGGKREGFVVMIQPCIPPRPSLSQMHFYT